MQALIQFAARHAVIIFAALLTLTALAATQLPNLRVEVSAAGLVSEDDPIRQAHARNLAEFGQQNTLIVVAQDAQLFTTTRLQALQTLNKQLQALPFVAGTDSLFTAPQAKSIDDDIRFSPYLETLPPDAEAAQQRITQANHNPLIAQRLLSQDGQTFAIYVRLKADTPEAQFTNAQIVAAIDPLLAQYQDRFAELFALGSVYELYGLSQLIKVDQTTVLPWSVLALLLTLLLTLRRWSGMIMPLLTAFLSIIWTLGFMAYWDIPISVMTSIVPALLIVIGSTEDIHLLSSWYRARDAGADRAQATTQMAQHTGLAILLTAMTTYAGFLSIALNDIQLLQDFGMVASTGLLFNFIITTLLVPASLQWTGQKTAQTTASEKDRYAQIAQGLFRFVKRFKITVIVVTLALVGVAVYGSSLIRVDNDNLAYFSDSAEIHRKMEVMHQSLAGVQSFNIVLDGQIQDTFLKVRYLENIRRLQRYLRDSGHFDKSTSFADYISLVYGVMDGLPPNRAFLPDDDAIVSELMLFIGHDKVQPYVSEDFSRTNIVVQHNISSSHQLKQALADLQTYADNNLDAGLKMQLVGSSILSNIAADRMVQGQIWSLLFMLLVIILLMSILFVDLKAGILAAIPNSFPVILLFGIMGFFDIPLNTGTIMVAAVAVGICVDDTMHFLVSYNQQMRYHSHIDSGILAAMKQEARPIMSTSLALMLGFSVLAFSQFPPVMHFGVLSAVVMLLAVIANFILMPVLLRYIRIVTVWDILGVKLQSQLLHTCPLFKNMRPFEVRKLIAVSCPMHVDAREQVVKYGEQGDELFVLLSGQVVVSRPVEGRETEEVLKTLEAGAVFGEVALVGQVTRTANVYTTQDSEVLRLPFAELQRLSRYLPRTASKLYFNIAQMLATRLASTR